MASYNGSQFIDSQIISILFQLGSEDELVIVDDSSTDETTRVIEHLNDPRIRLHANPRNLGVNESFARAIGAAKRQFIFLADQDDIWLPNRRQLMEGALVEKGALLVSANQRLIDKNEKPIEPGPGRLQARTSAQHYRNIASILLGTAPYFGCCMAMRAEIRDLILPIPSYIESHDLWIALAANLAKSNLHLEDDTLLRRIHGQNLSVVRRPLLKRINARLIHLRAIAELKQRLVRSAYSAHN
jgi:glycosyltransferase involved in cell wall biosynthesis